MAEQKQNAAGTNRIIYEGGQGEIVEKKSRFIVNICPAETEEEAVAFIAAMKKKYWDARHNCSAFVIGPRQELTRCSDDGEPAQTAGRPMLEVLLHQGITNVAVVVTRYFGGVLLGTGGLVRAYQKAVMEGLSACRIMERRPGYRLKIRTDYSGLGKLQYLFARENLHIADTQYEEDVVLSVMVPREDIESVQTAVIQQTNGKAELDRGKLIGYGIMGDQVVQFALEEGE